MPLLGEAWRTHAWSRVLDLGSGTGSNVRYLAPRLPGPQEWTLLDHNRDLLDRVDTPECAGTVQRVQGELENLGLVAIRHAHLVTGSALLDLVSEGWLGRSVEACRRGRCAVYFALTYDGEITWSRPDGVDRANDPDDTWIQDAVNLHQRRDKGLGPALGPTAATIADIILRRAGYRTWLMASPWHLGPDDAAVAHALVDGWASAALALDAQTNHHAQRVRAWARRRQQTIERSAYRLTVGHVDLLALPDER